MIAKAQLEYRAQILKKIRQYFEEKNVLEVETPLGYPYPVTDPFIDAFEIQTLAGTRYLQTSPEYAMKRLLASGSGSIYQICKAFRDDPKQRIHHYEFTMLEWYRVGISHWQLMDEVVELFHKLSDQIQVIKVSYASLFKQHFGINPHQATLEDLVILCGQYCGEIIGLELPSMADCFDLLFSTVIEPTLVENNMLYIVYHYPRCQSALSRLVLDNGDPVSARFELFMRGMELGNGYGELTDAKLLRERFELDLSIRRQQGKKIVPMDDNLLDITGQIPACSGIAVGLDRVLLALGDLNNLDQIMMRD